MANGEPIANAVSAIELQGGFLPGCFLAPKQPNPDFLFGWSVWECPTQLFWCDALVQLSQGHISDTATMLGAQFRNASVAVIGQTLLWPAYAIVTHPQYACLIATGSSKLSQVLVQTLNLAQGPQDYGAFSTGKLWYDFASYLFEQLETAGVLDGRPLLVAGHSYGAASVLVLAVRIKLAQPATEMRYVTYGCPKPGDVRLMSYLDKAFDGLSLVNDGDLITALPPSADVIAALSDLLPTAGLANWTRWAYCPETTLMRGAIISKNTYQRYDSLLLANFLVQVALQGAIGTVTPHDLTEYDNTIQQRCKRFLPTDLGDVLGMQLQPAILAKPGQVLGMVFDEGPVTTLCCLTGIPRTVTATLTAAAPPNSGLVGSVAMLVFSSGSWQGFFGPPGPSGWFGDLICSATFHQWLFQTGTTLTFAVLHPNSCFDMDFTGTLNTPSGSSTATFHVNVSNPPPPSVSSLSFDGSTGYVDCGPTSTSQFPVTTPWSLSIWVKPSSTSSPQDPLTLVNPTSVAGWYLRYAAFGEVGIALFIYDGANFYSWRTPNGSVPTGTWTHIVFTNDGTGSTGGRLIYVNGVAVSPQYFDFVPVGGLAYGLAHCNHGRRGDSSEYFGGLVCQPALYLGVLSPGDVTSLFTGSDPTTVGTPTNVWRYTEGTGSTIADAVGTATGTLIGGVTWSIDIPPPL